MKLTNLIAAGLTATLLASGASYAQTAPVQAQVTVMNQAVAQMPEVQALIEELKAQGYTNIEIRRTLLGRARIVAQGPAGSREVVLSTATGEVMRDMMRNHDGSMADGRNGMDGNMDGGSMDRGNMDGGNMDGGSMDRGNMDGGNMGGSAGGNMGGSAGGNMGGSAGGNMGGSAGGNMGGGMGGN